MPQVDAEQCYWREVSTIGVLSREEEVALFVRYRAGDCEARDALIRGNLRFVISIARQFTGLGLTLEELVSEGNEGLMVAIERFDHTCGYKLITLGVWWIRQRIFKALHDRRLTTVPLSQMNDLRKFSKARTQWTREHGDEPPDLPALAESVGLSARRLDNVLVLEHYHEESLDAAPEHYGPEAPTRLERLMDETPNAHLEVERAQLWTRMEDHLAVLDRRDQRVVRLYFGLDGEHPATLEEIGKVLGVTRERVRQLRDKALTQLRTRLTDEERKDLFTALHTDVFA